LVGCSTGSSAGLAPFNIGPTASQYDVSGGAMYLFSLRCPTFVPSLRVVSPRNDAAMMGKHKITRAIVAAMSGFFLLQISGMPAR
jgi:hypothetical protein